VPKRRKGMEEIQEDEDEDGSEDEGRVGTGNWGQQYISVEDYFNQQQHQEDDWQPEQPNKEDDDLPRFGRPDNNE
jgi:hypothetical protein